MDESDTRVARYGDDTELFLETLPPPVPRYIYRESHHFHKILGYESARFRNMSHALAAPSHEVGFQSLAHRDTLPDDNTNYIIFLIEPSSFQEEIVNRNNHGPLGFFYEYDRFAKILIIKMTTRQHRCATRAMNTLIEEALKDMGLGREFESFAGVEVNVGANLKVPDEGWAPMMSPLEGSSGPAVVLEVGVSESDTKLRGDAKMWVDPSRGQANIAITIKIKQDRPLLKIDEWEWDADIGRPRVNRHIEITGARGTASVSGEPLLIPFHQIWRRTAQYPREKDIVLNVEDLAFLATHVWGAMGIDY
ncbi:uncharacterized protein N7500_009853 [Penicillium coprophilum]|uniref:uncharacterized protein n=1 Tax=Penicillium coprophilum TaxID=36646 RepID=UPI00239B51E1|nr:uncharacterized protein N7500_009853 [Penicillium coprophilum]KAJ5154414.1 hypothetical protein N7500_009853 [Penicillium coprophilum]